MWNIAMVLTGVLMRASAYDYCQISASNTRCLHPNVNTMGPACTTSYPIGISALEKQNIVGIHNDYRRRVASGQEPRGSTGAQPSASNMREMYWDEELADMAQTHANQCVFRHDTNRNIPRGAVGQNIAIQLRSSGAFTSADWTGRIAAWYNEVDAMVNSYIDSFPASAIGRVGHYSQIVWAETYLIGCGVSSYYDASFIPFYPYKILYVCNYALAGNYINQPIYKRGAPASSCPAPNFYASNNLCARVN